MTDDYVLAIDFGTSNTSAAIRRETSPPAALRLGSDSDAIPSATMLRDGELLVGQDATRLAALDPSAFERTPKRRLGQNSMLLRQQVVDPVDLVAAVLQRVLDTARRQSTGQDPASVVLTHPQTWSAHLLSRLRKAASLAGIPEEQLVLLPEPLAAAWWHASRGTVAPGEQIAVVDFGGGTLDVAHLEAQRHDEHLDLRVGRAAGIDPLGGDDFDELIETWVLGELAADGHADLAAALTSENGLAARLTLREDITRAKHALSHHASTPVVVNIGPQRVVLTLTTDAFEQMIRPSLERAIDTTRGLLAGQEVNHLFLTGGSSLIPLVQREFQQLTSGRVGTLDDPKQVTALGALVTPRVSIDVTDGTPSPQTAPPAPPTPPEPVERSGQRRLWAGVAGVAALVAIIASAWAITSHPGADPMAGPGSGIVTSVPITSTTTTTTQVPPEEPEPCPGLTASQCALATTRASLLEDGSCQAHEATAPALDAVRCVPRQTASTIEAALFLYRYDSLTDMEEGVSGNLRGAGIDPSSVPTAMPTTSPAKQRWKPKQGADPTGSIYSFIASDNVAWLIWTYDDERVLAMAGASGGDLKNLYAWWQSVGDT